MSRILRVILLSLGVPLAAVSCREAGGPGIAAEAPSAPSQPSGPAARAKPPASGPMDAAQCKALLASTDEGFQKALAAASLACKTDADCAPASAGCYTPCGGSVVAASDLARYNQSIAPLERECARFNSERCAATIPLPTPSCMAYSNRCSAGRCERAPLTGVQRHPG